MGRCDRVKTLANLRVPNIDIRLAGERMSLAEALHATKLARPCIAPNSGFMMQLVLFSKQLGVDCALLKYAVFNFSSHETAALASSRLLEYKAAEHEETQHTSDQAIF
jgi:hypothetical protein